VAVVTGLSGRDADVAALLSCMVLFPADSPSSRGIPPSLVYDPREGDAKLAARAVGLLAGGRQAHSSHLEKERGRVDGMEQELKGRVVDLISSSRQLLYTVALTAGEEADACSFILSARLSHPLSAVEVIYPQTFAGTKP
jgi:hypothetical protein